MSWELGAEEAKVRIKLKSKTAGKEPVLVHSFGKELVFVHLWNITRSSIEFITERWRRGPQSEREVPFKEQSSGAKVITTPTKRFSWCCVVICFYAR